MNVPSKDASIDIVREYVIESICTYPIPTFYYGIVSPGKDTDTILRDIAKAFAIPHTYDEVPIYDTYLKEEKKIISKYPMYDIIYRSGDDIILDNISHTTDLIIPNRMIDYVPDIYNYLLTDNKIQLIGDSLLYEQVIRIMRYIHPYTYSYRLS